MSSSGLKRPGAGAARMLAALRGKPARFSPWTLTRPKDAEDVRWESPDGRWVAVAVGAGGEAGPVVVTDSSGRREIVGSYEGALALAKFWRT